MIEKSDSKDTFSFLKINKLQPFPMWITHTASAKQQNDWPGQLQDDAGDTVTLATLWRLLQGSVALLVHNIGCADTSAGPSTTS